MDLHFLLDILQCVTAIYGILLVCIKPFRRWFFNAKTKKEIESQSDNTNKEAIKCLLRNSILQIYYLHKDTKTLHQFEYENLAMLREVYISYNGNSFVSKIWEEINEEWTIIP